MRERAERTVLFSVIVPVYNYAHTLDRCVNSILSQEGASFEIILVNDGSTDNSDELCRDFAEKTPELISYIFQENAGPAKARNNGFSKSKGLYITFLDADDEMEEGALKALKGAVEALAEPAILLGAHRTESETGVIQQHPVSAVYDEQEKNFLAYLIEKSLAVSNGAIFFHQEVLEKIKFPEQVKNSEDIPVFALALANYPCIALSESLVKVHKHKGSLRNQIALAEKTGLAIVPLVFDSELLPQGLQQYREPFLVQRLLSLFRTFYLAGEYRKARQYYRQAIAIKPSAILRGAYLRKFIKSFL